MTDAELETLLDNWGRWCREHRIIGECESIEHLYRSPQEWDAPPPPPPWKPPISRNAALQVYRAWLAIPDPYKSVIADWYVRHSNPAGTCRRLRLVFRHHRLYLDDGRRMVRNQLTRQNPSGITLILLQDIADTASA